MEMSNNLRAFLMTIRYAEGTDGPDGYRTMFGGRLFEDYSDHPRRPMQFRNKANQLLWTSAAGAYQFMAVSRIPGGGMTKVDTWDRLQKALKLPDFSPESQDKAAIKLIDDDGALRDVEEGRFEAAINKCRGTWASLPGAGYAQPEKKIESLKKKYLEAGGELA